MLSREHRLYKAFKQMRDKEKEYQRKRDEMGWRGLDGPFTKEEIELHKEFFEFMKKVNMKNKMSKKTYFVMIDEAIQQKGRKVTIEELRQRYLK